jgi:uncharacterized protein (TIGR02588 family)
MSPRRETAAARPARSAAPGRAKDRQPRHAVPLLEWIVGTFGAVLVVGAIAFLLYHALTREQTPPDVRVVAQHVLDLGNGYLVQFRAFNEGRSAASQVTIEAELTGPDGEAEIGEVVIDYLPARSGREGGLWFSRDPRAGQLTLRAKGYATP